MLASVARECNFRISPSFLETETFSPKARIPFRAPFQKGAKRNHLCLRRLFHPSVRPIHRSICSKLVRSLKGCITETVRIDLTFSQNMCCVTHIADYLKKNKKGVLYHKPVFFLQNFCFSSIAITACHIQQILKNSQRQAKPYLRCFFA